ncbi:hypothetical protein ACFWCF_01340 [Rhodococcus sp. NPDC060090]
MTKDVAEFAIVGGVPARALGLRFKDEETRAEHLALVRKRLPSESD